jgi:membrane-bound ClpP family serine protease
MDSSDSNRRFSDIRAFKKERYWFNWLVLGLVLVGIVLLIAWHFIHSIMFAVLGVVLIVMPLCMWLLRAVVANVET